MNVKSIGAGALMATAIAAGGLAVGAVPGGSAPAQAAATCGNATWERMATTHAVVQSCEAGAQVTYKVQCATSGPIPIPGQVKTVSRYFETSQTGITPVKCGANSSAQAEDLTTILSIEWSYS